MITRFDHAVVAVTDVDSAIADYRACGFDVAAGGRHPNLGTGNAIVRFGLDYLELLAVEDLAQARAAGAFGSELVDFLTTGPGLVGFVLASDGLDDEAAGLAAIDQDAVGPFAMSRERPDGRKLAWRLVIPGGSPWRRPWPFLIEWETPDSERMRWDAPGRHDNGARGVAALTLLVADLDGARRLYEAGLGLTPASASATGTHYVLGDFSLDVRLPANADESRALEQRGPGPWELVLAADDEQAFAPDALQGARIRFAAD